MTPKSHTTASPYAASHRALRAFAQEAAAVTSLEYALLGSLIAAVAAAGIGTLGNHVQALWNVIANAIVAAM